MSEARDVGLIKVQGRCQRDGRPSIERPLRFHVKRPDRLDLIAKELDTDWVGGIGGKDVEDASAQAKLSRYFHDFSARHPPLQQPTGQVFDRYLVADSHNPRHPGQGIGVWNRLKRGLEWGDDETGGIRTRQSLQDPHAASEHLIRGVQLARKLLPGGKDLGHDSSEGRHVVAEIVDVTHVCHQDDQRCRRMQPQCGARQCRRRAPGSVNRSRFGRSSMRPRAPEIRSRACTARVRSLSARIGTAATDSVGPSASGLDS